MRIGPDTYRLRKCYVREALWLVFGFELELGLGIGIGIALGLGFSWCRSEDRPRCLQVKEVLH